MLSRALSRWCYSVKYLQGWFEGAQQKQICHIKEILKKKKIWKTFIKEPTHCTYSENMENSTTAQIIEGLRRSSKQHATYDQWRGLIWTCLSIQVLSSTFPPLRTLNEMLSRKHLQARFVAIFLHAPTAHQSTLPALLVDAKLLTRAINYFS